ncbi:MAG: hypothetical protein GF334_05255 [Candidatus Altiarchaeales archaeon]|nr:hypothetical protein [Candidatus Altiarchaeales archaeon]
MKPEFEHVFLALGFASAVTQVSILREFYAAYSGNEVFLAVTLGFWLALTGVGAQVAGKGRIIGGLSGFAVLFSLAAPATTYLVSISKPALVLPGQQTDPLLFAALNLLILSPLCLLNGAQIASWFKRFHKEKKEQARRGYVYEGVGSAAGGVLFTFILATRSSNLINVFLASFVLLAVIYVHEKNKKTVLMGLVLFSALFLPANQLQNMLIYGGENILFQSDSQLGRITVTEDQGQIRIYENNEVVALNQKQASDEKIIHYPLLQVASPEKILLISKGFGQVINEAEKYPGIETVYLTHDPIMESVGRRFLLKKPLKDVSFVSGDPRKYIKKTEELFDAVIIDVGDPSTLLLNRFYTNEFLAEVKEKLTNKGVVCLSLTGGENIWSRNAVDMNKAVYGALKNDFEYVMVLPGSTNYFLAARKPLKKDYAGLIQQKNLTTTYLTEKHFEVVLSPTRINQAKKYLSDSTRINTDLKPAAFKNYLFFFSEKYGFNLNKTLILGLTVLTFLLFKLKPYCASVFGSGFSASLTQVTALFTYQIGAGVVYHNLALFIALFMLGLSGGAASASKLRWGVERNLGAAAGIALTLFLVFDFLPEEFFLFINLLAGFYAGLIYNKSFVEGEATSPGGLWSLDILGGFFGAVFSAAFLIPLWGVREMFIIVGFINLYLWTRFR